MPPKWIICAIIGILSVHLGGTATSSGIEPAEAGSGNWTTFSQGASASGLVIYQLEGTASFKLKVAAAYTFDGDFVGPHITFIDASGAVAQVVESVDMAHWGDGDGVAYFGVGNVHYQSGRLPTSSDSFRAFAGGSLVLPATRGWIVVAYDVPARDLGIDIFVESPATLVERYRGPLLRVFEPSELEGGATAGTPAAAAVHIGNSLEFVSAEATLLSISTYHRPPTGSVGRAQLRAGPHMFEVNFARTPDLMGDCLCGDSGEIVTLGPDFGLGFTYAGSARNMRIYGYVGEIPSNLIDVDGGIYHQEISRDFGPPK